MSKLVAAQLFLFLAALSDGSPLHQSPRLIELESTPVLPAGWRLVSDAGADERLHLRIALTEPHTDYLQIAQDVSDPSSSRYGFHLSAEELQAVIPDMQKTAEPVLSWLESQSVQNITWNRDWINFYTTVKQAHTLFGADFARYEYLDQESVLRARSYSIPQTLTSSIDFIYPVTQFLKPAMRSKDPVLETRQHIPTGPSTCSNSACPKGISEKYNINYRPADNKSGGRLGVAGFLEQYPDRSDLQTFLTQYGLHNDSKPYTYAVERVNGGQDPETPAAVGVEAILDVDYAMAFADPLNVTFYSTGGRPPTLSQPGNKALNASQSENEPYFAFLSYLLNEKSPPQVISISYSDDEQSTPPAFAQKVCNLFAQLAARGVSVIVASGDGGAQGTGNSDCKGPNGKKRFVPTFPSSCPWVTSVGATAAYGGAADYSSGGFSNYFGVPTWQSTATQHYVSQLNNTHAGYYNKSGRGIPDVSLLGDDYLIVSGGYAHTQSGTSAATPVFASMILLLNDIRLRAGKPTLGFLNPLLYAGKAKTVFRDVTQGSSNGCADSSSFEPGWDALAGWDPATGLGEPDFVKLRALLT